MPDPPIGLTDGTGFGLTGRPFGAVAFSPRRHKIPATFDRVMPIFWAISPRLRPARDRRTISVAIGSGVVTGRAIPVRMRIREPAGCTGRRRSGKVEPPTYGAR
jgi:hypothetical protein